MNDPLSIIAGGLLGLFVVYLVARLISAAYFKSKQEHDQQQRKIP